MNACILFNICILSKRYGNDMVKSFNLCRAYKSYKSNGGPHDPQKTNKPLHMRYGYQVILNKHSYLSCLFV